MIFRDDVVFLIEEYTQYFGQPPVSLTGPVFPRRRDWAGIVQELRRALDSGQPVQIDGQLSHAA